MIDDKVWWNRERKCQGICEEIAATRAWGGNVLVLAHFDRTLSSLEAALRSRVIECHRFSLFDSPALCAGGTGGAGRVWAGLARTFQPPGKLASSESSSAYLEIIVAEHHPLRSRDELLIQAAATIPCRTQVSFHISLDDPLIIHFCGDSIQKLFKRLGASAETALSNPMITTAIRQAQEQIESQVPRDLPASSAADWFKHNFPDKQWS